MNDGTFFIYFIYFIYFVILFFVAPFVMKRVYKKIETIIRMKIKKLRDADGDIYFSAESRQFPGVVGGGRTKKEAVQDLNDSLNVYIEFLNERRKVDECKFNQRTR